MDTFDVLVAARAEIEKGWCKRTAEDSEGNVCAMGAVGRVLGCKHDDDETVPYFLLLGMGLWCGAVRAFNDRPSTTKVDVIALYDRAIAAEAVRASSDPSHVYTLA